MAILRIIGMSSWSTYCASSRASHSFDSKLIRLLIIIFVFTTGALGRTGLVGVEGIHGSCHTLISYPKCTLLLISKSNSFLAAEIRVQTYNMIVMEASFRTIMICMCLHSTCLSSRLKWNIITSLVRTYLNEAIIEYIFKV